MTLEQATNRLRANGAVIAALVENLPDREARWKPSPEEWSILEVVNHLCDEEREDFRTRIDYTLHRPAEKWPPIDPPGWVISRGYNTRDVAESVANFQRERAASLAWLAALADPDWDAGRDHPAIGRLRAGDLLASWVAHDYLHIRQLNALHFAFHQADALPYDVRYAGEW